MINGEGLLFDLNYIEEYCGIYNYDREGEPENSRIYVRITDWWRRFRKQFIMMNAQHFQLLAMSSQELRDRLQ
jgi:hypothetical protein